MSDTSPLKAANSARWEVAKMTRAGEFIPVARRLVAGKATYQQVEARTGVPWVFIAVTHEREASQNWTKSLAQGDPWNKVSTHVPAGRGPFKSWVDAAVDALVNCGPYASRNKDWSVGGTLALLEQYNGLGYYRKGIPSPYIWSGTDQYHQGKYIADGVFSSTTVDKQLGCAGLIMEMMKIDPSITFSVAPAPVPAGTLKDAAWLQHSLNLLGATPPLVVDGINGPSTRMAVSAFQRQKNLVVDGKAGPQTIGAIDKALSEGTA